MKYQYDQSIKKNVYQLHPSIYFEYTKGSL